MWVSAHRCNTAEGRGVRSPVARVASGCMHLMWLLGLELGFSEDQCTLNC